MDGKIAGFIIAFILIGETFFRDAFHILWFWIGIAVVVSLIVFHSFNRSN